jgi:hypothetical protein
VQQDSTVACNNSTSTWSVNSLNLFLVCDISVCSALVTNTDRWGCLKVTVDRNLTVVYMNSLHLGDVFCRLLYSLFIDS